MSFRIGKLGRLILGAHCMWHATLIAVDHGWKSWLVLLLVFAASQVV